MNMTEARDLISKLFMDNWNDAAPVYWQGVAENQPPNVTTAWARHQIKHGESRQATFGEKSARRFTRTGIITIQVFTPISTQGGGLGEAEELAELARDSYEGINTNTSLSFYGARTVDVGANNGWYQINVIISFTYDEVK